MGSFFSGITQPLATQTTPGAMASTDKLYLDQLDGVYSGAANLAGVSEMIETGVLDWTQAQTVFLTQYLPASRIANASRYAIFLVSGHVKVTAMTGVMVTAATMHIGNNASAYNNISAVTTPSAAAFNNGFNAGVYPFIGSSPAGYVAPAALIPISTAPRLVIDSGASGTGGFSLSATLLMRLYWVNV